MISETKNQENENFIQTPLSIPTQAHADKNESQNQLCSDKKEG